MRTERDQSRRATAALAAALALVLAIAAASSACRGKSDVSSTGPSAVSPALDYPIRLHPDAALKKTLDDLIVLIAKAQEPDGYLFTTRTNDPAHPPPRAPPT